MCSGCVCSEQARTGELAHFPLTLASRPLLVGQSLGPLIFAGCTSIHDHFPGGVEDLTGRYAGWGPEVGSLVTAQWLRTDLGQKRCAEVRSRMKLSRSRAGKAEFKGNGELRNMSLATRLLKNQPGLSSAQTLFRIFLNVTRSTVLGPFLPHLPTYSLLRHTDSPAFPLTRILQPSLFSSLLGSPSLDRNGHNLFQSLGF